MEKEAATDIAKLSFEEALAELERIVRDLEGGSVDLESSIKSYERGTALKKHCDAKLKEVQGRIEKITISEDGQPFAEPVKLSE